MARSTKLTIKQAIEKVLGGKRKPMTVAEITAAALPLVLLPQGADQFDNASVCATLGLAEVILPTEITINRVRDAVDALLTNQSYRAAARSVAAEISTMPTASAVADEIADTLARKSS